MRAFALERFFAKHEFSVKHLACASDPDSWSVREVLALEPGAEERLLSLGLGYTEAPGHPDLRAAIAALYDGLDASAVLVHAGAEEAIFAFMNVALAPGDDVIVHFPTYQSLYEVAASIGATVSRWEAREAAGWQLDPDDLAKLCTPRTKAIVLNAPHNPTGSLITRDRLDATVRFARERGLWLFGDEVYRGLEHGAPRNPSVVELYERGVSLGATAKVYGLAGLRIGWLAARDPALLAQVGAFKDYLTICSAGPSELLATIALRHADRLAARGRAIVTANISAFEAFMAERPGELEWVRPVAGTTAFPRLRNDSVEAYCARLLDKTGVLLLPGPLFDFDDAHFRLGLGRSTLGAALEAWRSLG